MPTVTCAAASAPRSSESPWALRQTSMAGPTTAPYVSPVMPSLTWSDRTRGESSAREAAVATWGEGARVRVREREREWQRMSRTGSHNT